jgi:hypothetical protein
MRTRPVGSLCLAVVLLFVSRTAAARDLTFEDHVAAQEAIERVYSEDYLKNTELHELS